LFTDRRRSLTVLLVLVVVAGIVSTPAGVPAQPSQGFPGFDSDGYMPARLTYRTPASLPAGATIALYVFVLGLTEHIDLEQTKIKELQGPGDTATFTVLLRATDVVFAGVFSEGGPFHSFDASEVGVLEVQTDCGCVPRLLHLERLDDQTAVQFFNPVGVYVPVGPCGGTGSRATRRGCRGSAIPMSSIGALSAVSAPSAAAVRQWRHGLPGRSRQPAIP
jgi:hypothetical protein